MLSHTVKHNVQDNLVQNVNFIVYYLLDIHHRTGTYYICFHHQNIPHCNVPSQGLEKDPVCLTHAGGATVPEQSSNWSKALPLKQQILFDFLCPPFLVQPGRREGNGSFLCESPELPQPTPYHLSLTYSAQTRLRESCAAHSSSGTFLSLFM